MSNHKALEEIIEALVIKEYEETRLDKSLVNANCLLKITKDTHVPDTLTRIRVLPTVSVVGQASPVSRSSDGGSVEIYVKFLPNTSDDYKNLINIAKLIRGLPGVKMVKVTEMDGKRVAYKGKPIIV